jgi:hypothetical protein
MNDKTVVLPDGTIQVLVHAGGLATLRFSLGTA